MNLVLELINKKFTNPLAIQREILRISNLPMSERKPAFKTLYYQCHSKRDLIKQLEITCPSYYHFRIDRPCDFNCTACWESTLFYLFKYSEKTLL